MDNYSYPPSYAESGGSSPRSPPWEEQQSPANNNYKVKFMCSYGGKVLPRPNDNQLSYIGGETKILSVDRSIKLSDLVANLSSLCNSDVCFKYQMPGEDLDALISVTNEDDLDHMMNEYDRLHRGSSKPARMRLFLFPVTRAAALGTEIVGSSDGRSERERLVEALNSGPVQAAPPPPEVAPTSSIDLLLGFEKTIPPPPASVAMKFHDSRSGPEIPPLFTENQLDPMNRQIQNMQMLQIGGHRWSEDGIIGGLTGEYYSPKQKMPPATSAPPGYWPDSHIAGGFYHQTSTPAPEQPLYMMPSQAGFYQTRPATQGYYAVHKAPPDICRDQPLHFNMVNSAPPATTPLRPQLPPQNVAAISEGFGRGNYMPMGYDGGGRQVYYNALGGMALPPPYQPAAESSGGGMNQESKRVRSS